jgi:hypothetical protein
MQESPLEKQKVKEIYSYSLNKNYKLINHYFSINYANYEVYAQWRSKKTSARNGRYFFHNEGSFYDKVLRIQGK